MKLRHLVACTLITTASICLAQQVGSTPPPPATPTPLDTTQPLPSVADLLLDVEKHEDRDQAAILEYTYHVHTVEEDFDGSESVKKTTTTDSQSFTVGGVRIRRVLARNGTPLTPDQAKMENENVDKEIAKRQASKAKRDEKQTEGKGNGGIISASRMLQLGTFSNERRVLLNGRSTVVLDYAGNRAVKAKDPGERIVEDLVGTVWIDEADRVIARAEGHFLADFKLGFGLLADIHKGLSFTLQNQKINDEVWLTKEVSGQGKASVGVFILRVHGRSDTQMSDYRKFRTDAKIVSGSQVIGEDGKPVPSPNAEPTTPTPPKP